jgi:hypothetical protein
MSDISQKYSDDEDIASYNDNMHDLDGFAHSHKKSTMTVLGKGSLILMGTMVMGNLYLAPPTLEKVTRCPVSLILTRSYRRSKVRQ